MSGCVDQTRLRALRECVTQPQSDIKMSVTLALSVPFGLAAVALVIAIVVWARQRDPAAAPAEGFSRM
jgi:hypothetical protein